MFRLELFEVDPREAWKLVEAGGLHAAIALMEKNLSDRLQCRTLWMDPLVVMGPQNSHEEKESHRSLHGIGDYPWVLPRKGSAYEEMIRHSDSRVDFSPRVVGRSDDWDVMQKMAAALQAYCLVPRRYVRCGTGLRLINVHPSGLPVHHVVLVVPRIAKAAAWLKLIETGLREATPRLP
jgi:DNA-binding transcriptional LysR family regulator